MSIIIHVKNTSKENSEKEYEIGEDSIIDNSDIKKTNSTVNKPMTSFTRSNNLNDRNRTIYSPQIKSETTKKKTEEIQQNVKTVETESYSIICNQRNADKSE